MIPLFILKNIIVEISAIIYYNVYNVFFRFERKINMKKKGLIILFAALAVIGLIIGVVAGSYNGLVEQRATVDSARSQISVQLQRRADLIPNFVATVKGYSDYEQSTYTAVTEARAAVSGAKTASEQAEASAQLDKAINVWVNAVTEAYPDLKANEQYKGLQDELAGTENRLAVARKDYNEAAKEYNVAVKRFPKNIIAGMFGFSQVDYFEAQAGTENVPQVSFD